MHLSGRLFGFNKRKKRLTTFDRRPDDYYSHVHINKFQSNKLDFIAYALYKSKKETAADALARGMKDIVTEQIRMYNAQVIMARETGQTVKIPRFIRLFRLLAKQQGGDISKFI